MRNSEPLERKKESSEVRRDKINPNMFLLEQRLEGKILHLQEGECAFDATKEVVDKWKSDGRFIVYTAGSFDLLTINHILGLTHMRLLAALSYMGLDEIDDYANVPDLAFEIAASEHIKLIVTLDTNRAISEGKSRVASKGGSTKPVLDWQTRAKMLGLQSTLYRSGGVTYTSCLVDFITQHGPDCCGVVHECSNLDNVVMGIGFSPHMIVANRDSTQTINDLIAAKEQGLLQLTEIVSIDEGTNQYYDPLLSGPVKNTDIIRRIRA